MSLSIAQLRAVDAVARLGQISKAAQSLGVSQPLISKQIQTFEQMWKIRIFDRDGYSIRVTREAGPVMGRIRLALELLAEVEQALSTQGVQEAQTLSLGFSAHRLIMPALAGFVRQYPDVSLTTLGAPSLALIEALKRGDIHVASVSLTEPPAGLFAVELSRRPLVVYGPRDHALLVGGPVPLAALDGQPMVLWNAGSGTRRQFSALCKAAGVAPKVAMEVDTIDVAYAAVAAGIGLGVGIEGEVIEDAMIAITPLDAAGASIGHYLLCQNGAETRNQIAAFIAIAGTAGYL